MGVKEDLELRKSTAEKVAILKIKAEGRRDQAMAALKKAGFDSIEEAQAELAKREAELRELEAEAATLIGEFDEKYAEYLEQEA